MTEYQLDNILQMHHSWQNQAAQHEDFADQGSKNETCGTRLQDRCLKLKLQAKEWENIPLFDLIEHTEASISKFPL